MKIEGKKPGSVGTDNYIKKSGAASQGKKAEGAPTDKGDRVDISEKAREFSSVKGRLDSVPDVRGEMVVRFKSDIESGRYSVDADKVAEKIIEKALQNAIGAKK